MSYFKSLLVKNNRERNNGRALWKYSLSKQDFELLKIHLRNVKYHEIDPRDFTLYFAEWWKNNYEGGYPSKVSVFDSIGTLIYCGNMNPESFFEIAKRGALMMGIKWIRNQNTLYFKTMLLQGGLPLLNISKHRGNYERFLLAVLDEQPDTIEDFIFKSHITSILPISCRNEIIYTNCLEIVKAIFNDDEKYIKLLEQDNDLKSISERLKIQKNKIIPRERSRKPQNNWILAKEDNTVNISLRITLSPTYTKDSISNLLGFEVDGKELQLYIEGDLVCIFRRLQSGKYKTDLINLIHIPWNGSELVPNVFVIDDGNQKMVCDFIQIMPSLSTPCLWSEHGQNEWRLIKGRRAKNKKAALMIPTSWQTTLPTEPITISGNNLNWCEFEGEIELYRNEQSRKFFSGVSTIDWTIVSNRPEWMLSTNMPVVKSIPKVHLYDEDGERIQTSRFEVYYKSNQTLFWKSLEDGIDLPLGLIEIKIIRNEIKAYDHFFNIGQLSLEKASATINSASIRVNNQGPLAVELSETPNLVISREQDNTFKLSLDITDLKIPKSIPGKISDNENNKPLAFDLWAPFEGIALISAGGEKLENGTEITLSKLNGIRILIEESQDATISFSNRSGNSVVIKKKLTKNGQPLISFLSEIERVFYLEDAMNHNNGVNVEVSRRNSFVRYKIKGFTHAIDVYKQKEGILELYNSKDSLDLFAVPLNCKSSEIELIPILENDHRFIIPETSISEQFILISSKDNGNQLMPRFINLNDEFILTSPDERQSKYHAQLLNSSFDDEIWKVLLNYFNICLENSLPFSTFDELRSISKSSLVAARAFFFLGSQQSNKEDFIQKTVIDIERDLGFCFHWINKVDWHNAIEEIDTHYQQKYFDSFIDLIKLYFEESGQPFLINFIMGNGQVESNPILRQEINQLRAELGETVLRELPHLIPYVSNYYGIPSDENNPVRLLIHSPIAVAESVLKDDLEYPLWGGDPKRAAIRRNIQYSSYLNPAFYSRIITHVLNQK